MTNLRARTSPAAYRVLTVLAVYLIALGVWQQKTLTVGGWFLTGAGIAITIAKILQLAVGPKKPCEVCDEGLAHVHNDPADDDTLLWAVIVGACMFVPGLIIVMTGTM